MQIQLNVDTTFEVNELTDLQKFNDMMETMNMKINKSQLAREMGVDRRTVNKYLNGYRKPDRRNRESVVDAYYPIIRALLSEDSKQRFYYRRVLWQYLKDNHGLECAASTFRAYIKRHPEFSAYFNENKKMPAIGQHVRFETAPGKQAQLDWKESIRYETRDGERIEVNVAVLLLSYSRFRFFHLSLSKSQDVVLSFLTQAFEKLDGVPDELVTDNMSTVMTEARTRYGEGVVNRRFEEFAKDFGFQVKPCIAGLRQTKGKVEAPMKILDEIHAYQGKYNLEELHDYIERLCERINNEVHQGTGKIPILELQKEKNLLLQLPTERVRDSYRIKHVRAKVNHSNMVSYRSNQYSVPIGYEGERVALEVHDDYLWIYHNTKPIAQHRLTGNKLNYLEHHYLQQLSQTLGEHDGIDEMARRNLQLMDERYRS